MIKKYVFKLIYKVGVGNLRLHREEVKTKKQVTPLQKILFLARLSDYILSYLIGISAIYILLKIRCISTGPLNQ